MIQYDDRAMDTSHMVFKDEDYGSTVMAFFPDGQHQTVIVSDPPFEIRDYGEDASRRDMNDGEYLSSYRTEEDAVAAMDKLYEEWDKSDDEDDRRRFSLEDINDMERPDWFDEARVVLGYQQTDGWRGHTTFSPPSGWETLAYGWLTGHPDDTVRHKIVASDVHQAMVAGEIKPPVPMLWCFGITSNVFSLTSDVMIPEGTKPQVNEWLDGLTMASAESFDRAFS